ncbi:MAG: hypothetical protein QNK20_16655 [Aureibaculum sp.]|nr:hypothetical protein [Aureibaculum sp.]
MIDIDDEKVVKDYNAQMNAIYERIKYLKGKDSKELPILENRLKCMVAFKNYAINMIDNDIIENFEAIKKLETKNKELWEMITNSVKIMNIINVDSTIISTIYPEFIIKHSKELKSNRDIDIKKADELIHLFVIKNNRMPNDFNEIKQQL